MCANLGITPIGGPRQTATEMNLAGDCSMDGFHGHVKGCLFQHPLNVNWLSKPSILSDAGKDVLREEPSSRTQMMTCQEELAQMSREKHNRLRGIVLRRRLRPPRGTIFHQAHQHV